MRDRADNAPKVITSLTNDRVKAIRALDMRKVRKETGLFVAEGASLLVTARDHGFVPRGRHHEIYLGDPRRTAPARLKTVLRQPVRRP